LWHTSLSHKILFQSKSVRGSTIYEEKTVSFIFYRTQDKDIDAFSPIKPAESMARKIKKEKKHDYILGFLLLTSEKEVRFQLL